jgi:hypothetical protein
MIVLNRGGRKNLVRIIVAVDRNFSEYVIYKNRYFYSILWLLKTVVRVREPAPLSFTTEFVLHCQSNKYEVMHITQ